MDVYGDLASLAPRLLLGLLEDVSHARGAHANEELDELRGGALDEGHAALARQGLPFKPM